MLKMKFWATTAMLLCLVACDNTLEYYDLSESKLAWQYLNPSVDYGTLTDARDGQVYKTVKICDDKNENCQTWMAENLNYRYVGVKFREGTSYESDSTSWCGGGSGTIAGDCSIYGRLYTWVAAVDSVAIYEKYGEECGYGKYCTRFSASALATAPVRGVCPSGWHLPSNAEWSDLYEAVGGTSNAGQKLKANTSLWYSYAGTDEYGFSVLPAGYRYYYGDFFNRGDFAYFWSSSEYEYDGYYAWRQYFDYFNDYVFQDYYDKNYGFSVRCLKDSPDQGGEATNPSSSSMSSLEPVEESSSSIFIPVPVEESSSSWIGAIESSNSESKLAWQYLNPSVDYGTMTDARDGQVYKTVTIGTQTWMAENLNYDPGDVSSMGEYAWSGCYNDKADSCAKYGRLYTWEVAMDKAGCGYGTYCNNSYEGTQGICPQGWHLPSNTEWSDLYEAVGGASSAGQKLKANTSLWYSSTGTDEYGISVLPAGYRSSHGDFSNRGFIASFWSSTEYELYGSDALSQYFAYDFGLVDQVSPNKNFGFSVRCLKDSP